VSAFPLLEPPAACPVCRSSGTWRALHVYPNRVRRLVRAPWLGLSGCERCGVVVSHPLPSERELEAYYGRPDGWEARGARRDDRAEQLERKLAVKRERYARERDLLAPHLPRAGTPRRTLDFGCGLGGWLDVLQDDGWETWGLEPGQEAATVAGRRHRMVEAVPVDERFDLVVINHVIEHLRDPLAVVASLSRATVPGGRLFVSVPDLSRLPEHLNFKYVVASEPHLCAYTRSALASLLGLAGFRVLATLATPEWDAVGPGEVRRLKLIAEKGNRELQPSGAPLEEAIAALGAYGREVATALPEPPAPTPAVLLAALGRRATRGALRVARR
jgi:SAM-dependent methyltransferase